MIDKFTLDKDLHCKEVNYYESHIELVGIKNSGVNISAKEVHLNGFNLSCDNLNILKDPKELDLKNIAITKRVLPDGLSIMRTTGEEK